MRRVDFTAIMVAAGLLMVSGLTVYAAGEDINTRLFAAVRANDIKAVQRIIGEGADPFAANKQGTGLVDMAVDRGYFDIAHYLLAAQNQRLRNDGTVPTETAPGSMPSSPADPTWSVVMSSPEDPPASEAGEPPVNEADLPGTLPEALPETSPETSPEVSSETPPEPTIKPTVAPQIVQSLVKTDTAPLIGPPLEPITPKPPVAEVAEEAPSLPASVEQSVEQSVGQSIGQQEKPQISTFQRLLGFFKDEDDPPTYVVGESDDPPTSVTATDSVETPAPPLTETAGVGEFHLPPPSTRVIANLPVQSKKPQTDNQTLGNSERSVGAEQWATHPPQRPARQAQVADMAEPPTTEVTNKPADSDADGIANNTRARQIQSPNPTAGTSVECRNSDNKGAPGK